MMDNWKEMFIRVQLEAVITEREMMRAENDVRHHRGESPAYTEEAYDVLLNKLSHLEGLVREG